MRYIMALLFTVLSGPAWAHAWTPTYPELKMSYVKDVYVAEMLLWNSRADVSYYTFEVYTDNWEHIPWAMTDGRRVRVEYLERKKINIYIRKADVPRVRYICSLSLHEKQRLSASLVSSRVCSKVK